MSYYRTASYRTASDVDSDKLVRNGFQPLIMQRHGSVQYLPESIAMFEVKAAILENA